MKKLTSQNINLQKKTVSAQSGFSLIEIMIAALILSIGILGVAGLQIVGMKGTHQSYMKQQAMGVVQTVLERMYSNIPGVTAGNYLLPDSNTFDCAVLPVCTNTGSTCSVAEIARVDLHNVVCGYKAGAAPRTGGVKANGAGDISGLMNGVLDISCAVGGCAAGDVSIRVQWSEREFSQNETETAGALTDSIVINSRIVR